MSEKQNPKQSDLAGRYFKPDDYQKEDQLSAGLAKTHEQVGDDYFEGTIDQLVDDEGNETK
jgi:hypothetical protein